eukprot:309448-Prymnesium_polylepis.1
MHAAAAYRASGLRSRTQSRPPASRRVKDLGQSDEGPWKSIGTGIPFLPQPELLMPSQRLPALA